MTSITFAVRWIEATGNGDLHHERLFDSRTAAESWLSDAESDDEYGYSSTIFDHCGPRSIVPVK